MSFHCCYNVAFWFFKVYILHIICACDFQVGLSLQFQCFQCLSPVLSLFIASLSSCQQHISLASWFARSARGGHMYGLCARDICPPRTGWVFATVLWHCGWSRLLHWSLDRRAFVTDSCFSSRKAHGSCILDLIPVWSVLSIAFIINDNQTGYCILRSHFLSSGSLSTALCCPLAEKVGIWLQSPASAVPGKCLKFLFAS